MNDTSLPYAGTQGYAGTDTSKERAERDVREGTANERQWWVLGRLGLLGYTGMTVAELRDNTGWHHGVASSVLTALHKDEKISRLVESRGRCKIYVLPDYVDDREVSPYKPNSSHKAELDRLVIAITELANEWEAEGNRYAGYVEGSSIPATHRAIAQVLAANSDELRTLTEGLDGRNA